MTRFKRFAITVGLGLACIGCAPTSDVVARAGRHVLRVDDAAELLALRPDLTVDTTHVQVLADAWIDYALLADAFARDSSLRSLDLEPLFGPARDQLIVERLRERLVHPDTAFTDEQVHAAMVAAGMQVAPLRPEREPGANEREREQERERSRRAGDAPRPMSPDELEEEKREEYRHYLVAMRQSDAEATFLDSALDAKSVRYSKRAPAVMRSAAASPVDATGASDTLASTPRIAVTVGAWRRLIRTQSPAKQAALAAASDTVLQGLLVQQLKSTLLLSIAERDGVALSAVELDSLRNAAYARVRRNVEPMVGRLVGKAGADSVPTAMVNDVLRAAMVGGSRIQSLSDAAMVLRSVADVSVDPKTFDRVVEAAQLARGAKGRTR